ncbi:hypothetical protein D3C73_904120 [compost metagenome]
MQPRAGKQFRQAGGGIHRFRLRPSECRRILQHAIDQHRDEQKCDEIQKQRRHHFIDRKAQPQPQRHKQQNHTGKRADDEKQRDLQQ